MPTEIAQFGNLDALHTEQNSQRAAVMNFMGHNAPDRPLARDRIRFSSAGMLIGLSKIANGPLSKRVINHRPGDLQAPDQLGCIFNNGQFRLPSSGLAGNLIAAGCLHAPEPVNSPQANMAGNFSDRAQIGRGPVS